MTEVKKNQRDLGQAVNYQDVADAVIEISTAMDVNPSNVLFQVAKLIGGDGEMRFSITDEVNKIFYRRRKTLPWKF